MALQINIQETSKMYTYKQIGNKYIISINTSEEIVNALNLFVKRENKIRKHNWIRSYQ